MLRKLSMTDGLTIMELTDPSSPQPHFSARRTPSATVAPMRAAQARRMKQGELAKHQRKLQITQMHSWLQTHSVVAVPTVEISKEYRASLRECFNHLDADSGGTINLAELSLAMKALGFSSGEVKAMGMVEGLMVAGFSAQEVKGAGYSAREARAGGYSARAAVRGTSAAIGGGGL